MRLTDVGRSSPDTEFRYNNAMVTGKANFNMFNSSSWLEPRFYMTVLLEKNKMPTNTATYFCIHSMRSNKPSGHSKNNFCLPKVWKFLGAYFLTFQTQCTIGVLLLQKLVKLAALWRRVETVTLGPLFKDATLDVYSETQKCFSQFPAFWHETSQMERKIPLIYE